MKIRPKISTDSTSENKKIKVVKQEEVNQEVFKWTPSKLAFETPAGGCLYLTLAQDGNLGGNAYSDEETTEEF